MKYFIIHEHVMKYLINDENLMKYIFKEETLMKRLIDDANVPQGKRGWIGCDQTVRQRLPA